MGMPPAISVAVISERNSSAGELVIAASMFLHLAYVVVTPVSTYKDYSTGFMNACNRLAGNVYPEELARNIMDPTAPHLRNSTFWLAFDQAGYEEAARVIQGYGQSIEEGEYDFPNKLSLFEETITDPPGADFWIDAWLRSLREELGTWRQKIVEMQSKFS